MNLADETEHIKIMFLHETYSLLLVDSFIRNFQSTRDVEDSFIISTSQFGKNKPF